MRRIFFSLAFAAATLNSTGCYAFAPVESPAEVREGQKVRVHLSDAGLSEVSPALGPGVLAVEGDLLGRRADSMVVAVSTVRTRNRGDLFWNGESVSLSPPAVEQLEKQRLSRWRTAGAALLIGGVAYWLGSGVIGGDAVDSGGEGPGGGPTT